MVVVLVVVVIGLEVGRTGGLAVLEDGVGEGEDVVDVDVDVVVGFDVDVDVDVVELLEVDKVTMTVVVETKIPGVTI
jgi:hypothetical protein